MPTETVEQLDAWRAAALEQWTDHRIVDDSWVDTHIWFFLHAYADFAKFGLQLYGFTFRESYAGWLLVLKVKREGTQLVGFISGKTTTACMRQARHGLREDGLKWSLDKYA